MHKSITEAMTKDVKTIESSTTAQDAAQLMRSEDIGSLPIVDDRRLVGVVTDRDIAIRVVAEGKGADTSVDQIASKEVVCVDPQQSLEEAARLMAEHQVRRLPV